MTICTVVPLGPACVDLTGIRAGDRNEFTLTLHTNGTPLNLTGMTVTASARKTATDPDPAAITAVVVVTDAAAGKATIRWPGDEVRTALAGLLTWKGVWDLQVGSAGGDPQTLVAGKMTAEMDVTR